MKSYTRVRTHFHSPNTIAPHLQLDGAMQFLHVHSHNHPSRRIGLPDHSDAWACFLRNNAAVLLRHGSDGSGVVDADLCHRVCQSLFDTPAGSFMCESGRWWGRKRKDRTRNRRKGDSMNKPHSHYTSKYEGCLNREHRWAQRTRIDFDTVCTVATHIIHNTGTESNEELSSVPSEKTETKVSGRYHTPAVICVWVWKVSSSSIG